MLTFIALTLDIASGLLVLHRFGRKQPVGNGHFLIVGLTTAYMICKYYLGIFH